VQNQPLAKIDPGSGYSLAAFSHKQNRLSGELALVLAFSGGGSRAAALSYGVPQELRDTQAKLVDLRERVRALQDTVARTVIKAPVGGAVVGLSVHTVGGVVAPGGKILDIVPQDEQLIVEARVSPTDGDRVSPGLEAQLRFSAFNARTTPTVSGRVLTVSGDRVFDPNTKDSYYLARIQVTKEGMDSLRGLTLLPGMPVDVMIKTGERTFFEYLIKPLTDRLAKSFREE